MYVIAMLVEDKPGVMSRVADVFRRRLINIDTITVGRTEIDGVSRIVITLTQANDYLVDAIVKHLKKMIDVIEVKRLDPDVSVLRELALIKVRAGGFEERNEILQLVSIFRANVVDVTSDSLMIQVVGDPKKIKAFLDLLARFDLIEVCRTGIVAATRGSEALISEETKKSFMESRREEVRYYG